MRTLTFTRKLSGLSPRKTLVMSCRRLLTFVVVLTGLPWGWCQESHHSIPASVEFSKIVFRDVSELDLFETMIGNLNDTEIDVESGVFGVLTEKDAVSLTCLTDGWTLITDMLKFEEYALQMRAAQSRPPSLLTMAFTGQNRYPANYELCLGVREDDPTREVPMTAQVCDMNISPAGIQFGLCVPSSCSETDLTFLISSVLGTYDIHGELFVSCLAKYTWTWDTYFITCILSLFTIGVICGTTYDLGFRRPRMKAKATKGAVNDHVLPPATQSQDNPALELQEQSTPIVNENGGDAVIDEGANDNCSKPAAVTSNNNDIEVAEKGNTVDNKRRLRIDDLLDKVLMSFSVVNNGSQVLRAKKTQENLGALNGLRVLSMFWIILLHCASFLFEVRLHNVPYLLNEVGSKVWFEFIWKGTFAVDTFFVLSGLLVTFLTLKQMDKSGGKLNWILFYVHRFWRLTPVYMVCLGIWSSLLLPIGIGSFKTFLLSTARESCRRYWWTHLLYINNLVPYPGSINLCMGWTWYLANDMQFFVFSPIFIILLFKPRTRLIGLIALACVTAGSCIITAVVAGIWGFPVGNYNVPYNDRAAAFPPDADRIYAKPWCRIQAYTVGIFVGYLLYKNKGRKIRIPLIWNLVGWVVATGVMVAVLIGLEGTSATEPLPQWFAAAWLGVRRFLFATGVGWVAFACVTGNGGPVDKFLSWNFWLPMARLNYCAYLLHPSIIYHFLLMKKALFHYTPYEHMILFFGLTVVTYILALLITLLVEVPTSGVEKALLGRPSRK